MKIKDKHLWIFPFVIFIVLATLVTFDVTTSIDMHIYQCVAVIMNDFTTSLLSVLTVFGAGLMLCILCGLVFIYKQRWGIFLAIHLAIIYAINNILKIIISRARPEGIALVSKSGYSFPSAHSMASFCFYSLCIYLVLKSDIKYKKIFSFLLGLLIVIVGFSRIYLGVHFVSDVIGGFLISSSYILFVIHNFSFKT